MLIARLGGVFCDMLASELRECNLVVMEVEGNDNIPRHSQHDEIVN